MPTPNDNLIVVIGRGHSGTRLLSHTLYASGVFMGMRINPAGDTIPARPMYRACRVLARHVHWTGGLSWDFEQLQTTQIDPAFVESVEEFLREILTKKDKPQKGWKLPETILAFPWIVRMFPRARYLHIVRDPRDCLLGYHFTDDIGRFRVPYEKPDDPFDQRVASWKYQYDIVKATPQPDNFFAVRYEDFVLDQETTLRRLEGFLDIPLARIVVDKTRIGQWKSKRDILDHLLPLASAMREYGYE